jgi:hypothetical protein
VKPALVGVERDPVVAGHRLEGFQSPRRIARKIAWYENPARSATSRGERTSWWEDQLQVEALAAFSCWLELYDSGANADPTGKVQLLWELERLRGLLRAGEHAFHAARDRTAFERHVVALLKSDDGEDHEALH